MARKDQITSLMLRDHELEWSTVRRQRDRYESLRTLRESLNGESHADGGDPGATQAEIADALKTHCSRIDGELACAVDASRLLMRVIRIPAVDDDERAGMVELQVDKISPFPIESLVISHEVIAESEGRQDVLVAAAPLALVEALGETLRGVGMKPVAVDVELLGWWQLILDEGSVSADGRVVIIFLEAGACGLFVAENGTLVAVRSLDGPGAVPADEFASQIADDVRQTLTAIDLERGPCKVSQITIWHEQGVDVAALGDATAAAAGLAVDTRAVSDLPPVSEGLARRYLRPAPGTIDLVPDAWRAADAKRRMRKRLVLASIAAAVLWAAGVATVLVLRHMEDLKLQQEQAAFDEVREPANEVRVLQRRVRSLEHFTLESIPSLDCLTEVARALPQQVELKSYTYTRERVVLNGHASEATPVFDFKAALDAVELFSGVELSGPTKTKEGLETFRITIRLKDPAS